MRSDCVHLTWRRARILLIILYHVLLVVFYDKLTGRKFTPKFHNKSIALALNTRPNADRFVSSKFSDSSYFTHQFHYESFMSALAARADPDRYVILAMTDEAFVDMAINFYEASLRAHHVDNFLFVGVGRMTCDILTSLLIPCFYYTDDPKSSQASSYKQTDFIRKMNIRTEMILEALAANFTVIHTDTDVAFLANPLSIIKVIVCNLSSVFVFNRSVSDCKSMI